MTYKLGIVLLTTFFALICHLHEVSTQAEEHSRFMSYDDFDSEQNNSDADYELKDEYEAVLLYPPECGLSNGTHERVVGGSPATPGAWPWMAPLFLSLDDTPSDDIYTCGATIISDRHIITAAHCIEYEDVDYTVHLGVYNIEEEQGVRIMVENITVHPEYNQTTHENDVAILRLKEKIIFTDKIRPICLPLSPEIRDRNFTRTYPFIAGWGTTSYKGDESVILQEAQIPVVANPICKDRYRKKHVVIDDRVICAGYPDGGIDACQGDSGGPLMYPMNRNYYLIGIISTGYRCAEPGFPGLYMRVTSYLDFIKSNMK